jgi:hypothetical protein
MCCENRDALENVCVRTVALNLVVSVVSKATVV